jgi:hypothetical protein
MASFANIDNRRSFASEVFHHQTHRGPHHGTAPPTISATRRKYGSATNSVGERGSAKLSRARRHSHCALSRRNGHGYDAPLVSVGDRKAFGAVHRHRKSTGRRWHHSARSKPDGYTISQVPLPVFRAPFLGKTTYDPKTDFTYIIGVTGYAYGVVVRNGSRWKTFLDLLADAKEAARDQLGPRSVSGHAGNDKRATCRAPRCQRRYHSMGTASELGRLLVTFGAERLKKWPDAPTLRDLGIDFVANSAYGLAGPKGMDARVVTSLHDAFKRGMEERSFKTTLDLLDQEFLYMGGADYAKLAVEQIAEQQLLVDELGLKQESGN